MNMNDTYRSRNRWRSIVSIILIAAGCVSFVLSCVTAMVISSKD